MSKNRKTTKDIVVVMANVLDIPKAAAERYVNGTFEVVKTLFTDGHADRVTIKEFGTFVIKDAPPREGRNPRTGEPVQIPAKRRITFKPAPSFADELNDDI